METKNNSQNGTMNVNMEKNNPRSAGKAYSQSLWKSVLVGGVPGILIGAAGAYGIDNALAKAPGDEDVTSTEIEIREAHSVNDGMNFNEAFAAARAEVGPGGAFAWHGGVYGTFSTEDAEWIEMSAEERQAHSQAILSQVHAHPYFPSYDEPIIEPDPADPAGADQPVEPEFPVEQEQPAETAQPEMRIIDIEPVELEDGEVVQVGYGICDDHMMTLVDIDGDQILDTVVVDQNDNLQVDLGEQYQFIEPGVSLDGDYSNDAYIGDLL